MDGILPLSELEILWRVAGRKTPAQHAASLGTKFQEMRPRIVEMMLEMVILELEQDLPAVRLSRVELGVLLGSSDPRVRVLGLRLLHHGTE